MKIDAVKTIQDLIDFLKNTFEKSGFRNAVIGLSGGVDSSTSFMLAVKALGVGSVYPVLMPYGALGTQGVLDAMNLIAQEKIPIPHIIRVDIRPVADAVMGKEMGIDPVRKGNIMARSRMMVLFDQAKKWNALVVGTENKSEHLLGYYTRFGDDTSDIEPLRNLYKTQVYALAKHLRIPDQILQKKPTAGLWEGQTDEGDFGFSYQEADEVLSRYFDGKKTRAQIIEEGIAEALVDRILAFAQKNDFKHTLPYIPMQ